jgi:hypothetical protein
MSVTLCTNELSCYWLCYKKMGSDVTVGRVAFLLCIREDQNWNLGSETDYHDQGFSVASSVLWHTSWDRTWNYTVTKSVCIISNSLFTDCSTIWCHIIWITASLSKQSVNMTRSLFHVYHVGILMYIIPVHCLALNTVSTNTFWRYHVSCSMCTRLSTHHK